MHNASMTPAEGARRYAANMEEAGKHYRITVYNAEGKIVLNSVRPVDWFGSGFSFKDDDELRFVNLHTASSFAIKETEE